MWGDGMLQEFMLNDFEKKAEYKIARNEEESAKLIIYLKTKRMIELEIVKEKNIIIFDTYTNYKGITEEERLEITDILKDLQSRMMFVYKRCLFIMPYEFIENEEEYRRRLVDDVNQNEMENVIKNVKKEIMTIEENVLLEVEQGKDKLKIFAIGEEVGKAFEYLSKKDFLDYKKKGNNFYEIEFKEKDILKMDIKQQVHKMIVFAREMKRINYNVWVNYKE